MSLDPTTLHEIRSRLGKRSRRIGSGYETEIAKKIANYFSIPDWNLAFTKTKLSSSKHIINDEGKKIKTSGSQRSGDLVPVGDMALRWYGHGLLGPIEAKHQEIWSFAQLLKNPEKSVLYKYWVESNLNTNSTRSVLFFSKMRSPDFVLHLAELNHVQPCLLFSVNEISLVVTTLENFLQSTFPNPDS